MTSIKWYGDKILAELRGDTPDALYAAAEQFIEAAKRRVPVASGDLRDSAYIGIDGKSTYQAKKIHAKEVRAKKGEAVAAFAAFYAKFVEYGTKRTAAKPFMRPTLDESKAKLIGTITARLKKTFEK